MYLRLTAIPSDRVGPWSGDWRFLAISLSSRAIPRAKISGGTGQSSRACYKPAGKSLTGTSSTISLWTPTGSYNAFRPEDLVQLWQPGECRLGHQIKGQITCGPPPSDREENRPTGRSLSCDPSSPLFRNQGASQTSIRQERTNSTELGNQACTYRVPGTRSISPSFQ